MKVLFLGGTRFIGRAMAQEAIDRGHTVTLFHRGRSGADLFPEAQHILGDRDESLAALTTQEWDAVFDVSGYTPKAVRAATEALQGRVGRYLFVSTFAVFTTDPAEGIVTEASAVRPWPSHRDPDEPQDSIDQETYGPLKVLCENVVAERFPAHVFIRPSIIAGPHDPTGRFTKWVELAATAERLQVAVAPNLNVRLTDVYDLASFSLGLLDREFVGPVNLSGPLPPMTLGEMWEAVQRGVGRQIPTEWEIEGAESLPLTNAWAERAADFSLAQSLGFACRPLADTAAATWEWHRQNPVN